MDTMEKERKGMKKRNVGGETNVVLGGRRVPDEVHHTATDRSIDSQQTAQGSFIYWNGAHFISRLEVPSMGFYYPRPMQC